MKKLLFFVLKFLLGGIVGLVIIFLYIVTSAILSYDTEFHNDLKNSLTMNMPLSDKWSAYLKEADTICFLPVYSTYQSVSDLALSEEAIATLKEKLSSLNGYNESTWWILGVRDQRIQYLLKMKSSMSPDLKTALCGDSNKFVLQAIANQPYLFTVRFD